ncbi:homoserine kinase [Sphingorhabdus contaminans]|uniref:homoserine kinase n=1 Tax=Sphingorhabdus contaminans TaxID=1343899 RepID=UPI003D2801AE
MAVYTQLGPEQVSTFLAHYDAGELVALKGIAEGVENSNYFVETTKSRFILTLYENRVDPADLPFFYALLKHLHEAGCKVPRFIPDKKGQWLQNLAGRPACLIEFLQGVSVTQPTSSQARATGVALGQMHAALTDFDLRRPNSLGLSSWRKLAGQCTRAGLDGIKDGLAARIEAECDYLERHWPQNLPLRAIHADLFPDNVLMLGDRVTGLIDFYFACTDALGYDLAVTHSAWCFASDGSRFHPELSRNLLGGYDSVHGIDAPTRAALPIFFRGACLRFLLTRCYDWINTPANALVTRKDPLAFLRRLDFYCDDANISELMGQLGNAFEAG